MTVDKNKGPLNCQCNDKLKSIVYLKMKKPGKAATFPVII